MNTWRALLGDHTPYTRSQVEHDHSWNLYYYAESVCPQCDKASDIFFRQIIIDVASSADMRCAACDKAMERIHKSMDLSDID